MKGKIRPRFDVDALRTLAGDKVFTRAEAYFHSEQVEILSVEQDRVLAQVAGTREYRTVLTGSGTNIGGECSCPAFDNWGFCKHLTAVALTANKFSSKGSAKGGGTLTRIREHLKTRGVDALVEMIVGLAERDPRLFRRLDMATAALDADEKTLKARLLKALDSAMFTRGYVEYSDASEWAAVVEAALNVIADLIPGAHAELAFELSEHAIDGIERAIEDIDDSDGNCASLLEQAMEIHLAACHIVQPDPATLAGNLFTREMTGEYGTFHNAAERYADALGEEGLAEYYRLAVSAWEKLPVRAGNSKERYEYSSDYDRLETILDFFATREDNVEARIALRVKDLSSPWKYLQLAKFCVSQDRQAQALRYAEEGLWVFEDARVDERLVFFAVDLMLAIGRKGDASKQLWRNFEQRPSLELYKRLRKLEGKAIVEYAIEILNKKLARTSTATPKTRSRIAQHSLVNILMEILTEEKMFDAAWAAVHDYEVSGQLKQSLARASEATHPREVLNVYIEQVAELVNSGGNSNYEEAYGLVTRIGKLHNASEQAAYVANLKTRFERKRNFMNLMA